MDKNQRERYVREAYHIVNGYTYPLPEGVSIECSEDAFLSSVRETETSVSVQAWVTMPKEAPVQEAASRG